MQYKYVVCHYWQALSHCKSSFLVSLMTITRAYSRKATWVVFGDRTPESAAVHKRAWMEHSCWTYEGQKAGLERNTPDPVGEDDESLSKGKIGAQRIGRSICQMANQNTSIIVSDGSLSRTPSWSHADRKSTFVLSSVIATTRFVARQPEPYVYKTVGR